MTNIKMSNRRVIALGKLVADELGITKFNANALMKKMAGKYPVPTIICGNEYQLWIDKYYIAYSNVDDDLIHYVYIHKYHVAEELQDMPSLIESESNACTINMLKNIQSQLESAKALMNVKRDQFYIFGVFKSKFEDWHGEECSGF